MWKPKVSWDVTRAKCGMYCDKKELNQGRAFVFNLLISFFYNIVNNKGIEDLFNWKMSYIFTDSGPCRVWTFTPRISQHCPGVSMFSVPLYPALWGKATCHVNPYCQQGIHNKVLKRRLIWKRAGWIPKCGESLMPVYKSASFLVTKLWSDLCTPVWIQINSWKLKDVLWSCITIRQKQNMPLCLNPTKHYRILKDYKELGKTPFLGL